MLSAYDFWQYWRNTEDADVGRFLKLYTTLPMDEIAGFRRLAGRRSTRSRRSSQPKSPPCCMAARMPRQAAETARKTFEEGALAESLPTSRCPRPSCSKPASGLLALIVRAGLAASNGEARRHVQGGAVKINDRPVADERTMIGSSDVTEDGRHQALARQEEAHPRPPSLIRRRRSIG
jgi:tyrosyl-tRNA synthetase